MPPPPPPLLLLLLLLLLRLPYIYLFLLLLLLLPSVINTAAATLGYSRVSAVPKMTTYQKKMPKLQYL
jgi:hypothetical protein